MSNNINWGKIYESTAWGSGVDNNTIGWGKSYADLAGQDVYYSFRIFSSNISA